MSRPAPWASSVAARRQVDEREGPGAGPVAPGLQQRVVGPRERQAVDHHERERTAGNVDALPETQRGEQARRLVRRELLEQAALRLVALEQQRVGELGGQRLGRRLGGVPAGEQRQCPPAGRLDE